MLNFRLENAIFILSTQVRSASWLPRVKSDIFQLQSNSVVTNRLVASVGEVFRVIQSFLVAQAVLRWKLAKIF